VECLLAKKAAEMKRHLSVRFQSIVKGSNLGRQGLISCVQRALVTQHFVSAILRALAQNCYVNFSPNCNSSPLTYPLSSLAGLQSYCLVLDALVSLLVLHLLLLLLFSINWIHHFD
jgi:hypothetical protein